jgi:replicative DNA helicase
MIEAEQNVLGAVLLDPASYFTVADLIRAEDFEDSVHVAMWRAFGALHDADTPIDVFTVTEAMGRDDGYAIELASGTPSAANIRTYAERVKSSSTARKVRTIGRRIASTGDLAEAQTMIGEVLYDQPGRMVTAREAAKAMFAGVLERHDRKDEFSGIRTGIPQLDDLTGGLQPQRVYALGGRAKMGKSLLAWQIAAHVATGDYARPVVGFSLEMSCDELMQRMACALGGVQSGSLLHPRLMQDEEWSRFNMAMGLLSNAKLQLSDRMDTTIDQMEAQVRQARPALVVIEQPNLETEAARLGYLTRRIKKLAKTANCAVIEVFQVNRGNEVGTIRPPRPSDARGSGTIEQDCDAMWLLHRPSYYDKTAERALRLDVALQRNGPTGLIRMEDELDRCRFVPSARPWIDPKQASGHDPNL